MDHHEMESKDTSLKHFFYALGFLDDNIPLEKPHENQ
jgi:hypothetical protein